MMTSSVHETLKQIWQHPIKHHCTLSLSEETPRGHASQMSICGSKIHLHYLQIVPSFKKWFLLKSNVMLEIRVMHETPLDVSLE